MVIGGLGIASVLTLFVTPVLYDLLARFTRPTNAVEQDLERRSPRADRARRIAGVDARAGRAPRAGPRRLLPVMLLQRSQPTVLPTPDLSRPGVARPGGLA